MIKQGQGLNVMVDHGTIMEQSWNNPYGTMVQQASR
jgi:hypothetical protein